MFMEFMNQKSPSVNVLLNEFIFNSVWLEQSY